MDQPQKSRFTESLSRPRTQFLVGSVLWILVQSLLFLRNGVLTELEAAKYLDQAHVLLQTGGFESLNFLYYSVEIGLIAFCFKFHLSLLFVVILQWILSGISMVFFYKTALLLGKSRPVAFVSTAALMTLVYYQEFNSFLYTESIYFSLLILFTWFLFSSAQKGYRGLVPVFLLMILLYFTRPTGIFLPFATLVYYLTRIQAGKKNRGKVLLGAAVLLALVYLLNLSLGSGGEFNFILPYVKENVICGVSTVAVAHQIQVPGNPNSLTGIFYIISHHPLLFLSLGIRRLMAFFGVYRTFYSLLHNTVLMLYFFIPYALIIMGIRSLLRSHRAEGMFLMFHIGLMALTVMITCDEWANRFIMGEYPLILLLAVISLNNLRERGQLGSKNTRVRN